MAQLRQRYDEFLASGATLAVVGLGGVKSTKEFVDAQRLPFEVLSDPDRKSHVLYGVRRGSVGQVATNAKVLLRGLQNALRGNLPGKPVGDGMQLSGTFIIDKGGKIILAERSQISSEFTPADRLLAVLRSLK